VVNSGGANPKIASYNASTVKIYNASTVKIYSAASSRVRFENKNIFFVKNALAYYNAGEPSDWHHVCKSNLQRQYFPALDRTKRRDPGFTFFVCRV
jgi:hypothetical protein